MADVKSSPIHPTSLRSHRLRRSGRCPGYSGHMRTGTPPRCRWLSSHLKGNFPHLIHLYSPCLHHSTSAQQCNSRPCSGTPCLSIYACHTVHHCCPHSRCRHHSARDCEYSSRFDSETRPPHTPWEGSLVRRSHPRSRCLHHTPKSDGYICHCHSGSPAVSRWGACIRPRHCGPRNRCLRHTATGLGCRYTPQMH